MAFGSASGAQTRNARAKTYDRFVLKFKIFIGQNYTSKALIDPALYALQKNPPDTEGDKNKIEHELIQILPPAVDVLTPELFTKGIGSVVLLRQVAKYHSVADTRTEMMDCIAEQDQRNDTIMTYKWLASILRCSPEGKRSIIIAYLQHKGSLNPLLHAQIQRRERVNLKP